VEAGHDRFDYELVARVSSDIIDLATLRQLAGNEHLNMTRLALNLCEFVNGVGKRHADLSARMFPGYRVHAITNGVHAHTWTAPSFARLYDRHAPGWCYEPELLRRADCCISDAEIWSAHTQAKQRLLAAVFELTQVTLDPDILTLGFARRMTAYKRPDLLFSSLDRLKEIAQRRPLQIVLAGKAHPQDLPGRHLVQQLSDHVAALRGAITVTYLPDYDMRLAQLLTSGVDVWLNTPLPPLEASGTSGMKAAFNGVPCLSVLDGWWVEGCIEGITGWAVGNDDPASADASALYQKLDHVVLPLYYQDAGERSAWIKVMKGAISKNAAYFNSHRMMRRYGTEAYVR
jgi:starch phosphorylase